jgi:hypothetical protein
LYNLRSSTQLLLRRYRRKKILFCPVLGGSWTGSQSSSPSENQLILVHVRTGQRTAFRFSNARESVMRISHENHLLCFFKKNWRTGQVLSWNYIRFSKVEIQLGRLNRSRSKPAGLDKRRR